MVPSAQRIVALFWRVITPVDFFNIERAPGAGPTTGGGQLYIDVPIGRNLTPAQLGDFFLDASLDQDDSTWPDIPVDAYAVGRVAGIAPLMFLPRRAKNCRYRIANQNRQFPSGVRHPAWTRANGFPAAPDDISSKDDPRRPSLDLLKIVIAKDANGQYFALYINRSTKPASWPMGMGLEILFQPSSVLIPQRRTDGVITLSAASSLTSADLVITVMQPTPAEELVGELTDDLAEAMAATGQFDPSTIVDARQRTMREIVTRRGQPQFRRALLNAYDSRCAVTGCDVSDALEAAHIIGYQGTTTNTPANGLLLRADVHTLFDLRLFAIDAATGAVILSAQLQGTHYGWLQGQHVRFPADPALRPSPLALNQQRTEAGL